MRLYYAEQICTVRAGSRWVKVLFYTAWWTPVPHCHKTSCKEINLVTFSGMTVYGLCLAPSDVFHWRMVLPIACCEYFEPWYNNQKTSIKDCESGNT